MKKDDDEKEDKVELKEKKEYIIYKDVINNYWEAQSYHPMNNFDEFITKKKAIRNAMLLLPMEPKDRAEKKILDDLIKKGLEALKKQPEGFKTKVSFIDIGKDKRRYIQEISAKDVDTWSYPLDFSSESNENKKDKSDFFFNFREEQYKECLEDLIFIEFKISKFLVKKDIIKKEDKSPDKQIEDWVKEEITNAKNELMNKNKKEK